MPDWVLMLMLLRVLSYHTDKNEYWWISSTWNIIVLIMNLEHLEGMRFIPEVALGRKEMSLKSSKSASGSWHVELYDRTSQFSIARIILYIDWECSDSLFVSEVVSFIIWVFKMSFRICELRLVPNIWSYFVVLVFFKIWTYWEWYS